MQRKYWMFTINNPADDRLPMKWDSTYIVYQKEKGKDGTVHLQGYVEFNARKRLSALKKVSKRAHWEIRRGTQEEAINYCKKDDTRIGMIIWEKGEKAVIKGQGQRSDIKELKRRLDEGATEKELSDEMFGTWSRNFRAIERYKRLRVENSRSWPTYTTVYWGEPGVGKSRRAQYEAGENAFWLPKPNGPNGQVWFDGYDNQETVVIDEFYGWISRDMLCRLCDRYPLLVQTKGGAVNFLAKKIIITSNAHPDDWYKKIGLGAMQRRLTEPIGEIKLMTGSWELPPSELTVLCTVCEEERHPKGGACCLDCALEGKSPLLCDEELSSSIDFYPNQQSHPDYPFSDSDSVQTVWDVDNGGLIMAEKEMP